MQMEHLRVPEEHRSILMEHPIAPGGLPIAQGLRRGGRGACPHVSITPRATLVNSPMRESELLAHIYERSRGLVTPSATILVGPGDDCAVVEASSGGAHGSGGGPLLLKVDQVVAGRHFDMGAPVDAIAHKAMARAVSDIAAMGGTPMVSLCGAVLPHDYAHADALFDAMHAWANSLGCPLVGGDISTLAPKQPGPLVLGVTIVGRPHAARGPVLRSTAKVGDGVYVTGQLGNSLASGRHMTFEPRVREGQWLCDALGAGLTAMMDISDGLGRDAGRMGVASGVVLEIDAAAIPLHADCRGWEQAAGEGEDYELLFCVDEGRAGAKLPAMCPPGAGAGGGASTGIGTRLTRIGQVRATTASEKAGSVIVAASGQRLRADEMGWEH